MGYFDQFSEETLNTDNPSTETDETSPIPDPPSGDDDDSGGGGGGGDDFGDGGGISFEDTQDDAEEFVEETGGDSSGGSDDDSGGGGSGGGSSGGSSGSGGGGGGGGSSGGGGGGSGDGFSAPEPNTSFSDTQDDAEEFVEDTGGEVDDTTDTTDPTKTTDPTEPTDSGLNIGGLDSEPVGSGSPTDVDDVGDVEGVEDATDPQRSTDPTTPTQSGLNTDSPTGEPNAGGVSDLSAIEGKAFSQVQDKTQASLTPEDVEFSRTDEGGVRAELADSGIKQEAATRREDVAVEDLLVSRDGRAFLSPEAKRERVAGGKKDIDPDDVLLQDSRGEDGEIVTDVEIKQPDETDRDIFSPVVDQADRVVDVGPEGSVVNRARQSQDQGPGGEQFGDIAVRVPSGAGAAIQGGVGGQLLPSGPATSTAVGVGVSAVEGERTEELAEEGEEAINEEIVDPAAEFAGDNNRRARRIALPGGRLSQLGREAGVAGFNRLVGSETQNPADRIVEGGVSGAGRMANPFSLALTAKEAAEFGVEGVEETVGGDGGEFAADAGEAGAVAGANTAQSAADNPNKFAGQVAGGAVASTGVIGAGRSLGGARASKAAATAVQPGEELAISLASRGAVPARVATKVPGVRRNQFIPESEGGSGRPLQDIEVEGSGRSAVESTDFRSETDSGGVRSTVSQRIPDSVQDFVDDRRGQLDGGRQRTRQRQRQRQRQEPEPDPTIEVDVRNDPLVRARQRNRAAQKSDLETRVEADNRLRSAQRLEAETTQATTQTPVANLGLGLGTGIGLQSAQANGIESITEPVETVETKQEVRTEPRTETRQETRQEPRLELGLEVRTEARTETRAESRTEGRSESPLPRNENDNADIGDRFPGLIGGDAEGIFTNFANPLTGDFDGQ